PASWLAELDAVAGALAGTPDTALARRVYAEHDWLRVTPTVLSFASGAPVELSLAEDPAPHASAPGSTDASSREPPPGPPGAGQAAPGRCGPSGRQVGACHPAPPTRAAPTPARRRARGRSTPPRPSHRARCAGSRGISCPGARPWRG